MNQWFRYTRGRAALSLLAASALLGCSAQGNQDAEVGSLALPLAANAPSGTHYRLRDATFDIHQGYYWGGSAGYMGIGGGVGNPPVLSVSSEDADPDAPSIEVDLEQGQYTVTLRPGWRFERVENGEATDVEATLLSDANQYVYVYPHSTTWTSYQFGIGGTELWLNGKVNINIGVYEDPDEYYGPSGGYGGRGGATPIAGSTSGGAFAAGGPSIGGASNF